MNIQKKTVLLAIVLTTAAVWFCWLISYSFSCHVSWYIYSFMYIGFVIGILLLQKLILFASKINSIVSMGLAILSILCTIIPLILGQMNNFEKRLDNLFGKQMQYNIEDYFKDYKATEFIFAFDKTEYSNAPTIKSTELRSLYNKYYREFVISPKGDSPNNDNMKYRDFGKLRLMFDIKRIAEVNKNGFFPIYTIGGCTTKLTSNEFSFSKENDIKNAIQLVTDMEYNETETKLDHFYQTIYDITKSGGERDRNKFAKYNLCIYSDFILDKKDGSNSVGQLEIKNNRKGTQNKLGIKNFNVIENRLVLESGRKENSILKEENVDDYIRTTLAKDLSTGDEFGNFIHNMKYQDIIIYYSANQKTSPNLFFSDSLFRVKIHKKNNHYSEIKLGDIKLSVDTYVPIGKGKHAIIFSGSKDDAPIIDIEKEDSHVHVLLELKAEEILMDRMLAKIIVAIIVLLLGISVPYSIYCIWTYCRKKNTTLL